MWVNTAWRQLLDTPTARSGIKFLLKKDSSELLFRYSKDSQFLTRQYSSVTFRESSGNRVPFCFSAVNRNSNSNNNTHWKNVLPVDCSPWRNSFRLSSSISKDGLQSREEVDNFLKDLTEEQRRLLYQQLHVEVLTEKYMNELASESHYLSKFGRPCSTGAEDHGTFTELPPKWLHTRLDTNQQDDSNANEAKAQSKQVAVRDLWSVGLKNAMPFVGFGFLDNLIMILAGDYIDLTIGAALGISTMAAAALGNTISDVAGIASVWYVEHFADKIGLPDPKLSAAQLATMPVRWSANIGRALGVIIGCLLGMLPLMFLNTSEGKKESKDKEQ